MVDIFDKNVTKKWIVSCSVVLPWVLLREAQKSRFLFLSSPSQRTTGFNANIFRNALNSLLAGWPKYVPFQCCLYTDIRKWLKKSNFPKDNNKKPQVTTWISIHKLCTGHLNIITNSWKRIQDVSSYEGWNFAKYCIKKAYINVLK